ncbi:hypothetical protein K501DRAFT_177643 [Backusella circina FSU 941]|nr:hypothetical protein K501DRAFT_177643 [Backusella circina FSU 941]
MTIPTSKENPQSPLSTSPKSNAFSLYAEASSTRKSSISTPNLNDSPRSQRRLIDNTLIQSVELAKNFVPPRISTGHSRQSSLHQLPERQQETKKQVDPLSLLKIVPRIVNTRKGSVLARNTILKMDHFSSGTNTNLDFHLQGAPNFRVAELNVYGVAQPTMIGLSTILAILNCHPKSLSAASCTWFSTREEPLVYLNGTPYVLREYADPLQNMSAFLGINSVRLEKVEERLKADVLKEAKSLGGLLLVHQELSDGTIVPCYIAADKIQTPKEVFQEFQAQGYRLRYFRIPISPEQAPEDNYFDEYINVIRSLEPTDPLIFNCGIGAVRTTVGIIIAQIIRRTQLIERGNPDPFPIAGWNYFNNNNEAVDGLDMFVKGLEEADNMSAKNHALLRLVLILEKALNSKFSSTSAIEWVLERGSVIENLKEAIMADAVINLRETILTNRIRQTSETSSSDYNENTYLSKALAGLQRYFFLLCFTAYVNESPNARFETRFSSWVRARTEIWAMLQNMRRKGPRLYFFRPVEDLHQLVHPHHKRGHGFSKLLSHEQGMFEMKGAGSQSNDVITVEMEQFIINSRTGVVLTSQTILKVDFWHFSYLSSSLVLNKSNTERHHRFFIDGASNFRRIENTHVYGVAQPTVNGLRQLIRTLIKDRPHNDRILWINLREEPIIYINGIPYVLRDRAFTLRNLRAYKGITGSRLEQLEERLKEDVVREVVQCGGRILLHGEDNEGRVLSAWEEVDVDGIMTVREVMESAGFEIMQEYIGVGRSTTGTVIATLLTRWIRPTNMSLSTSSVGNNQNELHSIPPTTKPGTYLNYQIINSLLRVIKHGLENKGLVDYTLDQCSATIGHNLRDNIEQMRIQAEKEMQDDPTQFKKSLKSGIIGLQRYFMFICFQAYLDSTSPSLVSETESFGQWMKRHPELDTILMDLATEEFRLLVPVEKSLTGDGMALSSEVMRVVSARHGQVLAQQTILKHDAFPGCQKMSLKEKIPGAYNFRRVEVQKIKSAAKFGGLAADLSGLAADMERSDDDKLTAPFICGCAMPNKDAIKSVLKAMNAGPGGKRKVLWTCLREEPVLYVNKQPYVLRLFIDPLKNLETTGISKERVESMEDRMKIDVLQELKEYDGRMLLHDEEAIEKGGFNLLPIWETVPTEQVETPSEVFESIRAEGYQVDFLRIPITDEQAPIPDVFDQLIHRMQEANQGMDILFNCQMGRGRTTTGMVVASLLSMILNNDAIGDMTDSFLVDTSSHAFTSSDSLNTHISRIRGKDDENDESHDERERYQNGEYRVILQLISVLTYGKLAKRLTDQVINMCDHMQNLRKAIYDYKLRIEAMTDQGSKKWRAAREVAFNYLIRYFYLIVFANYLLEEMGTPAFVSSDSEDDNDRTSSPNTAFKEARKLTTFKEWLKGRREIVNIISLQAVDLS